jgi:hypothetical protein|tara:strand:+ start:393 stop:815 length:423 start_codon:yes stop_codon:yes gene_type:complete
LAIKNIEIKKTVERRPPVCSLLIFSKILLLKKSEVCGGKIESKKFKKSTLNDSNGIYGIKIIINNKNGNIAVKKLNAIALALVDRAPLKIPIIYISSKSYKESPSSPGSLIFFKNLAIQFTIGILSILSLIVELIKQLLG